MVLLYRGADKSLARPGRKQATATKLQQVVSPTRKETSYSDQTLTLASHSKNKSEGCQSNQVSAAAMTSASDEKWRPFNGFFQSGRAKDSSEPLYHKNRLAVSQVRMVQCAQRMTIVLMTAGYNLSKGRNCLSSIASRKDQVPPSLI